MSPLDLTSEKISFTFQRLIQTDGTGGYYNGVGDPVSFGTGVTAYYQSSPPASPAAGDRWFHSETGKEYVYINDGSSNQWVEPAY
jgi:hypothetical protein